MKYQKKPVVKVGDTIYVEQAWEDERGTYHDELAKVLSIDENDEMTLDFFEANDEVRRFLAGTDGYKASNFSPL